MALKTNDFNGSELEAKSRRVGGANPTAAPA